MPVIATDIQPCLSLNRPASLIAADNVAPGIYTALGDAERPP
jgi:hypothetical protein